MKKVNFFHWCKGFFHRLSIQNKLIAVFLLTSVLAFGMTMYMQVNINQALLVIEQVYTSNAQLNAVSEALNGIQSNVKAYLDTKSSDTLNSYYSYEQEYRNLISELNADTIRADAAIMEKNIRGISDNYLSLTSETVEARRARNITKYRASYEGACSMYDYLNSYIFSLNNLQFKENSANYTVLAASLELMGRITGFVNIGIALFNIVLIYLLTGQITKPLKELSQAANAVAGGDFDIPDLEVYSMDEVGVVTNAFRKMLVSIREYIIRLKKSMEAENSAREREFLMENSLKDAQLKYYQAQIHPHFLFNTLNAGAQLAMMESAEKTYLFVQKMSEFFRYSMNNLERDVYLKEEIELVESYIYIMNVRFSGEICFEKDIACEIEGILVPGMILQPLVENALQYGIRDIDRQGRIVLSIRLREQGYIICVEDNGKGIEPERLQQIVDGKQKAATDSGNSNGVGLGNVKERLELYYHEKSLIKIESGGLEKGTRVSVFIPPKNRRREGKRPDV